MKKKRVAVLISLIATASITACSLESDRTAKKKPDVRTAVEQKTSLKAGEALFKQYCATCHPDGSNVSDPQQNLLRSTLQENHITSAEDIIRIMRHPISRMITFDRSTISDQDARAIAEYVLTTF